MNGQDGTQSASLQTKADLHVNLFVPLVQAGRPTWLDGLLDAAKMPNRKQHSQLANTLSG